jgi:hypothetical protein
MADPKSISFGEGIPPQMRSADFAMVQAPARSGRPLGFKLALPRDWKEVPSPPPGQNDDMSVAATFAASNDVNVIVMQTRIPFEINLTDWLEYQCHLRSFKIDKLQTEHAQNGTEVQAAAHTADGDLLRMAIVGDGDRVLWLIGRTIARLAVEYEETLGLAAASIRILSYGGKDTREPLNTYQDAASGIRLLYPASWQPDPLKQELANKSATDFRLIEGRETIAYLRVEIDFTLGPGKPALNQLLRTSVAEIEESGIKIRPLEPIPIQAAADMEERWLGSCDLPGGPGQVAMLFRRGTQCWLAAILISPDKTVNPTGWMRGKRFFEIAVATLRSAR